MRHARPIPIILFILGFIVCETQVTTLLIASPTSAATGTVPTNLLKIDEQSEDIIDTVPGGDWAKVNQDVASIVRLWASYQSHAAKEGVGESLQKTFSSTLTRLQTASASEDASGTMQAANDLSGVVMDLFDAYHPAIPADIGRLDVLERQIILDTAANNFEAATRSLAKVNAVWDRVKPSVLKHNGGAVAARFETSLVAQGNALKARDAKALTAETKNGLEIVDALEKVY
ncbi:MAG: hypothetical protein ACLP5H_23325 [Desulfomonilaceae bacterium]